MVGPQGYAPTLGNYMGIYAQANGKTCSKHFPNLHKTFDL